MSLQNKPQPCKILTENLEPRALNEIHVAHGRMFCILFTSTYYQNYIESLLSFNVTEPQSSPNLIMTDR